MKEKIFIIFIAVLFLASMAAPARATDLSQRGVSISVDGPQEMFVNHTEYFFVEIRGTFAAEAINWSIEVKDIPEGLYIEPTVDESDTHSIFQINVTAMEKGSYTFTVVGYCSDGIETRYRESTLNIDAYKPVRTEVKLSNPTNYELEGIVLGLFVDDELITTQLVDPLGANENRTVEIMWAKEKLSEGEHTLEVWADYGFSGEDDFYKGELLLSSTIHVEGEPGLLRVILPIVLVVAGVLFIIYYLRKRKRRRRPW